MTRSGSLASPRSIGAGRVALLLFGLAALLMAVQGVAPGFAAARRAYALPTLLAAAVIAAQVLRSGPLGLLHPVPITLAGFLVFFSAGPLLNPHTSSYAESLYSPGGGWVRNFALYSISMVLFLLGAWATGARQGAARRGPRRLGAVRLPVPGGRLVRRLVLAAAVLAGLLLAVTRLSGVGLTDYFLQPSYAFFGWQSSALGYYLLLGFRYLGTAVSAVAGAVTHYSRAKVPKLLAAAVTLATAALLYAMGARYVFLYALGSYLLVWLGLGAADRSTRRGRIWLAWLLALLGGVAVLQQSAMRNAGGAGEYLRQGPRLSGLVEFIDYGVDQNLFLKEALDAVPRSVPFLLGKSYLSTLVLFVPRQWWPDKPMTAWAYLTGVSEVHMLQENPNASFSCIGELYLNFGYPGIVLGMVLLGVAAQLWYQAYVARRDRLTMSVLYLMSLPMFAFVVRGDFQVAVGGMLYPMLITALLLRGVERRPRRRDAVPACALAVQSPCVLAGPTLPCARVGPPLPAGSAAHHAGAHPPGVRPSAGCQPAASSPGARQHRPEAGPP